MSDSKQSNKLNRFFAEFIAKLRKWLNKIGSPIRISRQFVRQLLGSTRGRRKSTNQSGGFILPTVTLVTLVVTLLVVTMVARSSDRARSAANERSAQVFRTSATPIVDRARAKLEALLSDDKLPRTTPAEATLDTVITGDSGKYTFPDETRLQLVYNIDTDSKIKIKDATSDTIDKREYASTAWKFPIDTDNNGLFDSYGLYSILFRSRPGTATNRPLSPLEARSLPMDESTLSGACVSTGGVTNLATQEGWSTSSDNKLKKAFFVYAVTVPIKDTLSFPASAAGKYELYSGTTSISAIELQQDRARSPQNNNAVWFEGDTELVNVATFRLNGRVYSAGNLMVGAGQNLNVTFFQISSSGDSTTDSKKFGSCYYEKKNSEIVVAGNVVEGDAVFSTVASLSPDTSATGTGGNVKVHLFQGVGVPPNNATGTKLINETTQSVDSAVTGNLSKDLALNDFAYSRRIKALVDEAVASPRNTFTVSKALPAKTLAVSDITSVDPPSVQEDIVKRILDEGLSSTTDVTNARRAALTSYFKERTRKVSYGEVSLETPETITPTGLFNELTVAGQTNKELVPRRDWVLPSYKNDAVFGRPLADFNLANQSNFDGSVLYGTGTGSLSLLTASATKLALSATEPALVTTANKETLLGDRVLVGNNLPAKWLKYNSANSSLEFVGDTENSNITSSGSVTWDGGSTSKRFRNTRAFPLSNLGASNRGGFWELSAAADPSIVDSSTLPVKKQDDASPRLGGLRVVTNAGIYTRLTKDTFLPRFRTGATDDSATTTVDESSAPVWKGSPQNNPITTVNELKFATPTNNFVVWQDSMPMTGGLLPNGTQDTRKGDLQMRATALYHYKYSAFDSLNSATYQLPIACVSSYYDPTNATTAKNGKAQDGTTNLPWNYDVNGRSNNGIVYDVKSTASSISGITYNPTTELFAYASGAEDPSSTTPTIKDRLSYQANLIFPNGRFANESLRSVLLKLSDSTNVGKLTLSEQSTLDSNICALTILDRTSVPNVSSPPSVRGGIELPHGSFRESAFLNGREVKSLNRDESLTEGASGNNAASTDGLAIPAKNRGDLYDLQIEQRQPVEVRVTDIDMDRLRGSKVTGQPNNNSAVGVPTEYLLPYSGIVYATREDALADLSYYKEIGTATDAGLTDEETRKTFSPLDFRLDPTRRPSAIRLINGYRLWRSALTTANLVNVDGTAPVSDATSYNTTYKWTEPTKGEKGLTLVSNLPVYIKAQYDPKAGVVFDPATPTTAPSFNKHTQEEFTLKLNETVPTITDPATLDTPATITALDAIWNNFYTRHAGDSSTPSDRLNPNFACRPLVNTACTDGDEWRPANIIADSATVLSANFRDGYRSDGDFDLRNNAHTSTSLNWQSQLNPNSEKLKDSSYALERRRVGFFNNNYVTSSNWMNIDNSDGKRWTTTQPTLWMGLPETSQTPWTGSTQTKVPQNGNMSSYNANGVTPVQRRTNFGEYGMEICTKLPLSECTFADWVKDGAGTTALPTVGTTVATSTPADAPRYIDPNINGRFARRLSFLRYDDLYKDGNQQLVMSGRCDNADQTTFPIPIAVQNGNLSTGFTYPQLMGGAAMPLDGTTGNNRSTYGTVPCPELALNVEIVADSNNVEGRRIDYHINTVPVANGATKKFSLLGQLGSDNLPDVDIASWNPANDLAPLFAYNNTNYNKGTVTNRTDDESVVVDNTKTTAPGKRLFLNDTSLPPVTPPLDPSEYSKNNAVYRRYNFQIRLNNPQLLTSGTAAVRLTLYRGSAVPAITATAPDPTRTLESASPLTKKFNATVPPVAPNTDIRGAAGATENPTTGGDYLNRIYSADAFTPTAATWNKKPKISTGADWETTVVGPLGTVLKRLPIDTGTALTTTLANPSPAISSTPETAKPEAAKCPDNQYCTIISWDGNGTATAPTNDPFIKNITVLVVRDSANEGDENFSLTLDNVERSDGGAITYINRTRNGNIRVATIPDAPITVRDSAGNFPSKSCFTPPETGVTNQRIGGYDDRERRDSRTTGQCGTGGGGGGSTSSMLPGYFLSANGHLGAAYPFKFLKPDGTATSPAQPIRTFAPPASAGGDFDAGRFVWGVNKGVGGATTIDDASENVFPDIPDAPKDLGAIPMLPGDPALAPASNPSPTTNNTGGGFRQGMTSNRPNPVDRALWFKMVEGDGDAIGTSSRVNYKSDRNLFINNLSFPAISGTSSNKANLNTFGRLMLPETVCINAVTGQVDERCVSKTFAFANNPATTDNTFLNLNFPYNPHYPSDNLSANLTAIAAQTPATAYAICGATGATRTFQPTQRIRTDITSSSCPDIQRTAITNFLGSATAPGTGLLSATLNPTDTTFAALIPDKAGTTDVVLRSKNTYSDNRVNVYELKNLGTLSTGKRTLTGTITLRANCVDPLSLAPTTCLPTARRLGSSPVFILRADSAEDIIFDSLKVRLDGVDPNNVFWIFPKTVGLDNLVFKTTDSTKPNVVTGNFLGVMPALSATALTNDNVTDLTITGANTSFRGVRFLGFRAQAASTDPGTVMAAITTVNQPELMPVLQLQFPNRTVADVDRFVDQLQPLLYDVSNNRKDSGINGVPKTGQGQWTIRPVRSEVNAYFVAGMTPSRNGMSYTTSLTAPTSSSVSYDGSNNTAPNAAAGNALQTGVTGLGETGGGLANFIRLLENWEAVPLKITGGFLQNTRSVFSTSPFASTTPFISGISGVPAFSDIQTLYLNPVLPTARMSGYNLVYQSAAGLRVPYYTPPIRLWGYDVGLLTQQPDRFAERFATPIPGANEFFREVSADDNWIKALLCALEPANPSAINDATSTVNIGSKQQFGTKPQNYTARALRGNDLSSDCTSAAKPYGGAALPVYDPAT